MLKWVLIFAALAIVCGILGFVVHVAIVVAKVLFFIFLVAFVISTAAHLRRRKPAS